MTSTDRAPGTRIASLATPSLRKLAAGQLFRRYRHHDLGVPVRDRNSVDEAEIDDILS